MLMASPLFLGSLAFGQKWEFGGGAGAGFYTSQTVTNAAAGSAKANIGTGINATAWLTNNASDRWSGELRYGYARGPLQLDGNGTKASFG